MGTIRSPSLFRRLVDLDVLDDEIRGVKSLGIGICFSVFQESDKEFGGFYGMTSF